MSEARGTPLGMRLREAVERQGSIRSFQSKMKEHGVRGSSYQMVHSYLAGDREPSLEFVRAAAVLLDVRETWLLTGSGPMTSLEDSVLYALQDRLGRGDDESVTAEVFRMGLSSGVEALLADTVAMYIAAAHDSQDVTPEQAQEMFEDIYWLCLLPRRLWGFQYGMPTSQLNSYMTAMLLALQLALRPPGGVSSGLEGHRASPIHRLKDAVSNE